MNQEHLRQKWVHISNKEVTIEPLWNINDVLYIKLRAQQGVLERVCIKRIVTNTNYLYIDTLNTLWNEDELISEEDALDLIG